MVKSDIMMGIIDDRAASYGLDWNTCPDEYFQDVHDRVVRMYNSGQPKEDVRIYFSHAVEGEDFFPGIHFIDWSQIPPSCQRLAMSLKEEGLKPGEIHAEIGMRLEEGAAESRLRRNMYYDWFEATQPPAIILEARRPFIER